ncbi:uncharacterized protein [Antedon mediterranea]|uniref:uncharacterized protein n=1 Tax=Antedon mediterranea TaxID=105859 RepID=UPI003AF97A14
MALQSLLLINTANGDDRNACFCNSIIQVLRRTYSIRNHIVQAMTSHSLKCELKDIFLAQGTSEIKSAAKIRKLIGGDFAVGTQQDAKEFMDTLIQRCYPSHQNPFRFTMKNQFHALRTSHCSSCVQDPISDRSFSLHLPLENEKETTPVRLQEMINRYFSPSTVNKRCSKCSNPSEQNFTVHKQFTESGPYLCIQLLRFNNALKKMNHFVKGSFEIAVQNVNYKLIAVINHQGLFHSGHYYSLLECAGGWYKCEDAKFPERIAENSVFSVLNYVYIFEKVSELGAIQNRSSNTTTQHSTIFIKTASIVDAPEKSSNTQLCSGPSNTHNKVKTTINVLSEDSDEEDFIFITHPPKKNQHSFSNLPKDISSWFNDGKTEPDSISNVSSEVIQKASDAKSSKKISTLISDNKSKNYIGQYTDDFETRIYSHNVKSCFIQLGSRVDEQTKLSSSTETISISSENSEQNSSATNSSESKLQKQPRNGLGAYTDIHGTRIFMKACSVNLGQRIQSDDLSNKLTTKENLEKCIGCNRAFKRIIRHLQQKSTCRNHYDLEKLKSESMSRRKKKVQINKKNYREAKRHENESLYKQKSAAVKQNQRESERQKNEQSFRQKRSKEKQSERVSKSQKNETLFKQKLAEEKHKQRESERQKNETLFKQKLAEEKHKQRESERQKNETLFKQKLAEEKHKQRESERQKNETLFKQKLAEEKHKQRESERQKNKTAFKQKKAEEKQSERVSKSQKNETLFKQKLAEEKHTQRESERQKNETLFKQKLAEEKHKQRESERQKNKTAFKQKRAEEKQSERVSKSQKNETLFKQKLAEEKHKQRESERQKNETMFKQKLAEEKHKQRESERQKNETLFKQKLAEEKHKQRESERQKNNTAFKQKRAEEKQSERDCKRQKNETAFKQKRAEEKQNERETERQKDEQSFKLKRGDEKQKGRLKGADSAFKRKQAFLESIRDGRTYICISCHRKLYKNGVHALRSDWESELEDHHPGYKEKCLGPIIRKKMPRPHKPNSPDDQSSDFICFTCHTYMIKGKMAPMSNQNNLQLVDISNHPELKLKDLENQLLARNLIFQKIKLLPKSRWNAMIDKTVNVPIPEEEISDTIEHLPRTPKEAHVIPVQLKRKKSMKNTGIC